MTGRDASGSSATPSLSTMQRLKEATRAEHARVEAGVALMQPGFSGADYTRYLERARGFWSPFEARLAPWSGELSRWGFEALLRTPLIEKDRQDLLALGSTDTVPGSWPESARPRLQTLAEVFGALYVMEGSALGGQLVTRHLAAQLGLRPSEGLRFLSGDGVNPGPRWKAFGQSLERCAEQTGAADAIVAGALETFDAVQGWFAPKARP